MKTILAFTGSNSAHSINAKLLKAVVKKIPGQEVITLDLKDYEVPIYSMEQENRAFPAAIEQLFHLFRKADGFIIASPEHNGLPTAFLKNTIDWLSRVDQKFFGEKPVLLLSTSPGQNGGRSGLEILAQLLPRWGGRVTSLFSLGAFQQNFDEARYAIENPDLDRELEEAATTLAGQL